MPKITLDSGLKLHYQRIGTGPDLVMVHGITGNLAVWHLQIVPQLADHFRVLTYDLRGHGMSDTPPDGYTPDDMAGDLVGLLDALEVEQPVIVGHSYGADIALYLATIAPERVREVIAIESALPALEDNRAGEDWMGWGVWRRALEKAGHEVPEDKRSDMRYLIRATIDIPKQWGPLRGLPRNPKPLLRLLDETSLPEDYRKVGTLTREAIPTIDVPVVLLYQAESAFIYSHDYLLEHLPDAYSILLPATEYGHFGPLEQPDEVAQAIITRLLGEAAGGEAVADGTVSDGAVD